MDWRANSRLPSAALGLTAALLAGCGAPAPYEPKRPELAEPEQLKRAERLYRDRDPAFAAVRDELAADPARAYWLASMFIRDVVWAWNNKQASDKAFLASVRAGNKSVEQRALEQLEAMGVAAVPAVSEELLRNRYSDRRRLGASVLAAMGPGVAAAVEPVMLEKDWRLRQVVVQAWTSMEPTPEVAALLDRATGDQHFAVRAQALRGLARQGDAQAGRLRGIVANESDAFVRRVAAELLSGFPDKKTATALVDYYADCLDRDDRRGVEVADASLRAIAGRERPGALDFWRAWLHSYEGRVDHERKR